jgi:uncharacterized membrane protein YeaQ/YmgE (transglycosylase-associated protein family)
MSFVWFILIGLAAGWLGNLIFKGSGSGFWINLLIGVVGAVLGGFLFGLLGIGGGGLIWSLISAVVGAVLLLWIISLVKGKKK